VHGSRAQDGSERSRQDGIRRCAVLLRHRSHRLAGASMSRRVALAGFLHETNTFAP